MKTLKWTLIYYTTKNENDVKLNDLMNQNMFMTSQRVKYCVTNAYDIFHLAPPTTIIASDFQISFYGNHVVQAVKWLTSQANIK